MNLFQKYGIKEVADVVFYSINNIGDEELYTPVLFLDTLKVSTLEKSAEKVSAQGGKGNKKLITWNFGKEITLNLEDALFTPASMSLTWGGKLESKLSPYTSAIVKLRLANKYAKLHYSTKAYPSPALTDEEWEIVFRAAQEVFSNATQINEDILDDVSDIEINFSSEITERGSRTKYVEDDYDITKDSSYIEENRTKLVKAYFQRSFDYSFYAPYIFDCTLYSSDVKEEYLKGDSQRYYYVAKRFFNKICEKINKEDSNKIWAKVTIDYLYNMLPDTNVNFGDYSETGNPDSIDLTGSTWIGADSSDYAINTEYENLFNDIGEGTYSENDFKIHVYDIMKGDKKSHQNKKFELNLTYDNLIERKAIDEAIIDKIIEYIDNIKKLGSIETQIQDTEIIDRMEKCIVKEKEGLIISTAEQKKNLLRYYEDDRTSSYCIYYDPKTMLPMLNITDDGFIQGWDDGIYDKNFNMRTDTDSFVLKKGTIYYKWSRTVKYKNGTDDGILGRTFVIDADTFPETYKIVGETYIRDQKTGKDHRFQFVINRAAVSSDTSITLEAEGDPTTFSMSVDVLTPPNDIMIELKEFDVDEDKKHGGTKILPERSKYSYTPASIVSSQTTTVVNDEIY